MQEVKIEVAKLLEVLKTNKEKHVKDYNEALVGYKEEVVKRLKKMLKEAKDGKNVANWPNLEQPSSHEYDYDFMISKLEATIDKTIDLGDSEFSQYYLDKWGWKTTFERTSTLYKKSL